MMSLMMMVMMPIILPMVLSMVLLMANKRAIPIFLFWMVQGDDDDDNNNVHRRRQVSGYSLFQSSDGVSIDTEGDIVNGVVT